tara:strand:- start:94520 stop:97204 length:2685 start_codon:yes stop_codon:yes gene_type:complete
MNDSPTVDPDDGTDRHPLETIATQYIQRLRRGHHGAIEPVAEVPEQLGTEIRDLLPVIQRLEQARKRQSQRPGGLASLGSSRPERLGDYQLVRQIGRGGMGVVFEAVQKSLDRKVAVKVLPKSLLEDQQQLDRFEREARTAGSLHHTNIVPVFGVGSDQGFHYYVMQRIQGTGLDRVLADQTEPFTPRQVAHLGLQAANALAYAHDQNVLHRDIKPANLIVNDDLDLWVTDFGVAKAIEEEASQSSEVVGTLRYMAPEQIRGDLDPRSDIYSLGCTLYELLAGRPAVDDATIRHAIVANRPAGPPPPVRHYDKKIPKDLERILCGAMAADLSDRYATATEMAADLQRFLNDEPIRIVPPSKAQLFVRWAKRNPAVAVLSAATAVLLLGIAALAWGRAEMAQNTLENETRLRGVAEQNAAIASGALDKIFQRFAIAGDNASTLNASLASAPTLSNEAAELLEELIRYYDDLASRDGLDDEMSRSAADARYAIGTIYHQLGQYERAIKTFEISRQACIAEQARSTDLSSEIDSTDIDGIIRETDLMNRIGFAWRMLGKDEQADEIHFEALQKLIADGVFQSSDRVRFSEAQTHFALSRRLRPGVGPETLPPITILEFLRHRDGRPAEGPGPDRERLEHDPARNHHLLRAEQLFRELYESNPEQVGYARWLAAALNELRSDSLVGASPKQLQAENEANEILRQLVKRHPENPIIQHDLATSLAHLNVFEPRIGPTQLEWGIDRLEEAVAHCQSLAAANPNVPAYLNTCAHTHFKLGVLLQRYADVIDRHNDPSSRQRFHDLKQQAVFSFRTAGRQHAMLEHQHPDAVGYRMWHALFVHFQAQAQLQAGQREEGQRTFARVARFWHRLALQYPDVGLAMFALAEAELTLRDLDANLDR